MTAAADTPYKTAEMVRYRSISSFRRVRVAADVLPLASSCRLAACTFVPMPAARVDAAGASDDGARHAARARPVWWAAAAAAAAAAALLVVVWQSSGGEITPGPDEYIGIRGGSDASADDRLVGIGITGVTAEGFEYEVLAAKTAYLDDFFRFSYSNERSDLTRLFIFGLQPNRPPIWYVPLPEERVSMAISSGRLISLDFEIRLASRHTEGPLTIVALFTQRPLGHATVASVASELAGVPDTELADRLRKSLSLTSRDLIQVTATRVIPGSWQK